MRLFAFAATAAFLAAPAPARFPVIGYFPTWQGSTANIPYEKLTHINYSFVLPSDGNGGLGSVSGASKLTDLVTRAHAQGVKVSIAVGGWNDGDDQNFEVMAGKANARTLFVKNLMNMVRQYQLDGVDIDWEYPDPGASADNYLTLMRELGDSLHKAGKILTAAVISEGGTGMGVKTEIFAIVDFLNLMAYDNGGGPHSPYELAQTSLTYWLNRGLPKAKAVLGLPFYGREPYTDYNVIVGKDADAPNKDQVGSLHYNGIATIQKKAQLAFDRGGGVMIWEISQDVSGPGSLLSAIDAKVRTFPTSLRGRQSISTWNPIPILSRNGVRFSVPGEGSYFLQILSLEGSLVYQAQGRARMGEVEFPWNGKRLSGVYTARMQGERRHFFSRFVLFPDSQTR